MGRPILDALIGQSCVELDMPLYTFNEKHYAVLPDLILIKSNSHLNKKATQWGRNTILHDLRLGYKFLNRSGTETRKLLLPTHTN